MILKQRIEEFRKELKHAAQHPWLMQGPKWIDILARFEQLFPHNLPDEPAVLGITVEDEFFWPLVELVQERCDSHLEMVRALLIESSHDKNVLNEEQELAAFYQDFADKLRQLGPDGHLLIKRES